MYIYGKCTIDKSGRVNLKSFFPGDTPKEIYLGIDVGIKMILVCVDEDANPFPKIQVILDDKGRCTLPSWVRKELPKGTKELVFVSHDGKNYLSPKTGSSL